MRIFKPENSFAKRINFVDRNNVLVGFSLDGQCCERFGYYFVGVAPNVMPDIDEINEIEKIDETLFADDAWVFNPEYRETIPNRDRGGGGGVSFELRNGAERAYLILFNLHNGYYAHNFYINIPGLELEIDSI